MAKVKNISRIERWSGNAERKAKQLLSILFSWMSRTFTPRRHAERLAIQATLRVSRKVLDTRGGPGNRDRIRSITAEINRYKGSKFFKVKNKNNGTSSRGD